MRLFRIEHAFALVAAIGYAQQKRAKFHAQRGCAIEWTHSVRSGARGARSCTAFVSRMRAGSTREPIVRMQ
jgi:hypothetical protein